ncbi:MAG: TonB family protein [Gemmatimonadetes bacterium]|nr:TonB family protein [Gemmatimonadota bacterium]
MLSALLFSALMAAAAWCAEVALRAARTPTRWPWLIALAASVTWPVVAPIARQLLPAPPASAPGVAVLPSISVSSQLPTAPSWPLQLDRMLLAVWIIASVIVLTRLVRALVVLSRIRKTSTPQVVDGLDVLVSEHMGPAVVGVVAPSVLVPSSLLDLDEPLRRLILRHEDEHRRAHDPWIVLGSAIAVALVPWNVPLWWVTRRARLALEVDCDARVLATNANAVQYGKLLLLIAQRQTITALAPMLAAYNSHLERRIDAMLATPPRRLRMKFAAAVLGTVVIGTAACTSRIGDIAAPRPEAAAVRRALPVNVGQPYFAFQVEKEVRQVPGTGNLRYPDVLRKANVEGQVTAQFIVDENGKYEPASFKELQSDHALFTLAIRNALPDMVFYPAEIGGKKVKQVVQQPFTFSLSKLAALGTVAQAPAANVTAPTRGAPRRLDAVESSVKIREQAPVQAAPAPARRDPSYVDFKVARQAMQIPGTGNLRYPDMLRSANIEGEVLAQFVVNDDGTYMDGSFKVIRSSHELFTEAVKNALPNMRFYPAEVDGKKVKQLLQQPFTFNLSR